MRPFAKALAEAVTYPIAGPEGAQPTGGRLYESLSQFLRTFSAAYPLPWALLVMGVVACVSLALYVFWEVVLRLLAAPFTSRKPASGRSRRNGRGG